MIEDVTAITVCYNTKGLMKRAYESIRKFYPDMKMLIIDNSDRGNPCAEYVQSLTEEENVRVIKTGRNVGHGPGMNLGLRNCETKYALIFDSDIKLEKDCLPEMLKQMNDDIFGVGKIVHVGLDGNNGKPRFTNPKAMKYYAYYSKAKRSFTIPYLHPFFQLINVEKYRKHKPYIHHGAPCLQTMFHIYEKQKSNKLLVNFPVDDYVLHEGRGTRRVYPEALDSRKQQWQRV